MIIKRISVLLLLLSGFFFVAESTSQGSTPEGMKTDCSRKRTLFSKRLIKGSERTQIQLTNGQKTSKMQQGLSGLSLEELLNRWEQNDNYLKEKFENMSRENENLKKSLEQFQEDSQLKFQKLQQRLNTLQQSEKRLEQSLTLQEEKTEAAIAERDRETELRIEAAENDAKIIENNEKIISNLETERTVLYIVSGVLAALFGWQLLSN